MSKSEICPSRKFCMLMLTLEKCPLIKWLSKKLWSEKSRGALFVTLYFLAATFNRISQRGHLLLEGPLNHFVHLKHDAVLANWNQTIQDDKNEIYIELHFRKHIYQSFPILHFLQSTKTLCDYFLLQLCLRVYKLFFLMETFDYVN